MRQRAIPGQTLPRGKFKKRPLEIVLKPRPVSEIRIQASDELEEWEIVSATKQNLPTEPITLPQPDPEPPKIIVEAVHAEIGTPLNFGKPVENAPVDPQALEQLLQDLDLLAKRRVERRLEYFEPYPKQLAFFNMLKRERLLRAGNQLGKSEGGAYEAAVHLTGLYPPWWQGRRFTKPVRMWICGESGVVVRDVQQSKLCGQPGVESAFGTGMIPKHLLTDKSLARGVTDAFDTIQIRHVSGGISTATFKSYEQGRAKFQGEPVDVIWGDEEPPMDVYLEMLTRTTATDGIVYLTFTPLKGKGEVVIRFMDEPTEDRGEVVMTIEDAIACGHITRERADKMIASWPVYQRKARAFGVPMFGEGRIFETTEESLYEGQIERDLVPVQWFKGWGLDFGIGHPFAAVLCAWDKDYDVFHVLHAFKVTDQRALQHAATMKPVARNAPVAWPQDGTARDKGSGEPLAAQYKREGLRMMPTHATHPDGSLSTEAAIMEMDKWMSEGRFKVASHLTDWFQEYREYHRKDGMIVKVRDDLLSATRVAFMMRRFFRQVALGGEESLRRKQVVADGVDFDLFS